MVSYDDPVNAAMTGHGTVTISGLNFGFYEFTPTAVAILDAQCTTSAWTSVTTVQCLVGGPARSLSAAYTRMTVGDVVGTKAVTGFSFDCELPASMQWSSDLSACACMCVVSLMLVGSLFDCMCSDHGWCAERVGVLGGFVFAAPVVSTSFELDVRNSGALSGGSTVTIGGLNFGSYSFTATASATGIDLCSTASWCSVTALQCLMVAPTTLMLAHAKVTVGGVVGTRASKYFTFDGMMCWCREWLVALEAVWTFGVRMM